MLDGFIYGIYIYYMVYILYGIYILWYIYGVYIYMVLHADVMLCENHSFSVVLCSDLK